MTRKKTSSTVPRKGKLVMVIKSTIPFGYTELVKKKYGIRNILFSPEFLRGSKALYDNLYPSCLIIRCDGNTREATTVFASLLAEDVRKASVDTIFMGTTETESVEPFSNTYLTLRMVCFNELNTYCETKGLNTAV